MKNKALILSSHGGGAHESSRKLLEEILQASDWEFKTVYPIHTQILGMDLGDQTYNRLLKDGHFKTIEILRLVAKIWFKKNVELQRTIEQAIIEEHPTHIISIIPIVNYVGIKLAAKYHIPYTLITVDRDLRNYLLPKILPTTCNFRMLTAHQMKSHPLTAYQIETGFAIRQQFLDQTTETIDQMKEDLKLPTTHKIVLLMMGAAGSNKIYDFAKLVLEKARNIHLVVFCGRNEVLIQKVQNIKAMQGNQCQALGFTDKVAPFMRVASLLITKPGPMSIEEAIATRCFVLLDRTKTLSWENENIEFVLEHQIGYAFRSGKELVHLMNRHFITNPTYPTTLPGNRFKETFQTIIAAK